MFSFSQAEHSGGTSTGGAGGWTWATATSSFIPALRAATNRAMGVTSRQGTARATWVALPTSMSKLLLRPQVMVPSGEAPETSRR